MNSVKRVVVPRVVAIVSLLALQCAPIDCFQQRVAPLTRMHRSNKAYPGVVKPRNNAGNKRLDTSLSATSLLSAVGSPVGSIVVLAGVILIHEAGHYLAARSLGISVEEFSIGVGPKLLGFQAYGNEFNLRALPLGGYVRFPENYNATQVQELQKAAMEQQIESDDENPALSGLMNFFTFGAYERKRREKEEKEALELEQKRREARPFDNGNWISNAFPFARSTPEPKQEPPKPTSFEIEYYDDPNLLQNRPWPQRALVLSGGVIFNILLAFTIFFGEIHLGRGLPKPIFEQGAVVSSLPRQESAANGLLEAGDIIISVDGSPISMTQSPNAAAAQQAITDFITKIRATPEGDSLNLSVIRKDVESPVEVAVKPSRPIDELGNVGPQSIGVLLRPNFVKTVPIRSDSVLEAASLAAGSVAELTSETTKGLGTFFGQLVSGKGAPAGQSVSGPIGLIRTGSTVVSTSDITAILTFAAAISVNLAVVNSLPLPALDGGQLIFVLSEAITGRKVDQRLQEGITSVALIFLLLVSFTTTIGDVENLFK